MVKTRRRCLVAFRKQVVQLARARMGPAELVRYAVRGLALRVSVRGRRGSIQQQTTGGPSNFRRHLQSAPGAAVADAASDSSHWQFDVRLQLGTTGV